MKSKKVKKKKNEKEGKKSLNLFRLQPEIQFQISI